MNDRVVYPWETPLHTKTEEPAAVSLPVENEVQEALLPSAPIYALTRVFQDQAALMWQESRRAEGYLVLRGESQTQLKPIAAIEETNYIDASAKPGKTYWYAVRAYNEHGQSGPTQAVSVALPEQAREVKPKEKEKPPEEQPFPGKRLRVNRKGSERIEFKKRAEQQPEQRPLKKDAPPAPKELTAAAHGTKLVALTWQADANIENHDMEYRLYRSATPWRGYGLVAETKDLFYLDAVPEAVTKYYYFVQAVRAGQASEPSAMAEAVTFPPLPPPEPPQNLRAAPAGAIGAGDGAAMELNWKHGRAAAAYVIYARQEGEEFRIAGYTLENSFLHEAPADAQMEYRVQSYHDTGASEPSAICSVRTRRQQQRQASQPLMAQNAPRRFPTFTIGRS